MNTATPIEKQISFYEDKINHFCDAIKDNPKGEECTFLPTWITWIKSWNDDIIILKRRLKNNEYNECLECKEKISKAHVVCFDCSTKNI